MENEGEEREGEKEAYDRYSVFMQLLCVSIIQMGTQRHRKRSQILIKYRV